jgi:tetratricopeptide (TPR) repeat protein
MGERRILTIGSQCDAIPPDLTFLPDIARRAYEVMTDPARGGCVPARPKEEPSLLLDPSVEEAKKAIREAYKAASKSESTLFIHLIGHGVEIGNEFYFLLKDSGELPDSDTAINLAQIIKELHQRGFHTLDGFVVLVDACFAGVAATNAAQKWIAPPGATLRFEILAAVGDRPAADGCFTKTLVETCKNGMGSTPFEDVRCEHLRIIAGKQCPQQIPQHNCNNPDPGLFISKNIAPRKTKFPWMNTRASSQIERLSDHFQPTPVVERLVKLLDGHRLVNLFGGAGCGKSSLAASLSYPKITGGLVPEEFIHAIVFISEATSTVGLSNQLAEQLFVSVPGFEDAQREFVARTPKLTLDSLTALQRDIIGPLRATTHVTRIILDGIDQLPLDAREVVTSAIMELTTDAELSCVHLLITGREAEWFSFTHAQVIEAEVADRNEIVAYLTSREIDPNLHTKIIKVARGNWLVVRLLAEVSKGGGSIETAKSLQKGQVGLYDEALKRLLSSGNSPQDLNSVLGVLAAAGAGPILPIELLCAASENLGGTPRVSRVRDILADLQQFVVRRSPGTSTEEIGLFHQSLIDYVFDDNNAQFGSNATKANEAIIAAIESRAPMTKHDHRNLLHRYATHAEPAHFWAMGNFSGAVDSLVARNSPVPADNLARLESWCPRIVEQLGADSAEVLKLRLRISYWTAEAGKTADALAMCESLFPEARRLLGEDHQETLNFRQSIADLKADLGDAKGALRLARALLPVQAKAVGRRHQDTLRTRRVIVKCYGEDGNHTMAIKLGKALLKVQTKVLGEDHQDTISNRYSIAMWTAEAGLYPEALKLFENLLPDQERIFGQNHPRCLNTRMDTSSCVGRMGKPGEALSLVQQLLPIRMSVLGPNHPDTLNVRNSIAYWTDETGDKKAALALYKDLELDKRRVLGHKHPSTLTTRNNVAVLTDECDNPQEAIVLYRTLLVDQTEVLKEDHPDTLTTRANIAFWKHQHGEADALELAREVLKLRMRKPGRRHPETLQSLKQVIFWTAEQGNTEANRKQAAMLLQDSESIFGHDHPFTKSVRKSIAKWDEPNQPPTGS